VGTGAMPILATTLIWQSGLVDWDASHVSTHWAWNPRLQHGKNRAASPSSSSARHTTHSTASSLFERGAGAARYTVAGRHRLLGTAAVARVEAALQGDDPKGKDHNK
jgi:hypothetical protein